MESTRQPTKEDYKKAMGANYKEEQYLSIKAKGFFDKEDWKPRWWDPEVLEKGVEINKKIIKEYEDLLKLVTVM